MTEKIVWGIHAGRFSEADVVFLEQKRIALGWEEMGDLRLLAPEREVFKAKVVETYPHEKPGSWPVSTGQLYRFVYEMKIGDLVVYPSKKDRKMHIGEVTGDYEYSPVVSKSYPHQRTVKWIKEVDRVKFSQGALYEIGSAMSFFQVRNFADEFLGVTQHQVPSPETEEVDSGPNADDMKELTQDYILKKLATELKGFPLENFIAHLLEKMGYHARVSSQGGDEGIDIIAHHDELGFEPPVIKVQIKSRNDTVKQDEVAALYGRLAGDKEVGLFVALGGYAAQARSFAKSKEKIRLIDGTDLVELIFEHYDDFDGKYKAFLPLRRVFMPDPEKEK